MGSESPPNYWDYLRLSELLDLQGGLGTDPADVSPDELHFIVVHQVYELWLKVVLRELRLGRDRLAGAFVPEEEIPSVVHHLGRVSEILKLAEQQWRVMETLSPQDFLAFRDKLVPASGFQSFQVRELEILLGLAESERLSYGETDPLEHIRTLAASSPGGDLAWGRIEAVRKEATVRDALRGWLYRTPIRGSSPDSPTDGETVDAFVEDYLAAVEARNERLAPRMAGMLGRDVEVMRGKFAEEFGGARAFLTAEDAAPADRARTKRIRAATLFIESYRDLPLLAWPRTLLDKVVETEQQFVIFRARHARMVERTIGRRVGTGGSSGVDYLDRTTGYRIFKELWAVRTVLLPKEALPPLPESGAYGFARGGGE